MKKLLNLLFISFLVCVPIAHSEGIFDNGGGSFFNSEPELLPVEKAFDFEAKQQGNIVKLSWVVADGYYMYKSKLKFESQNATLGDIELPEGKIHTDEYFGEQEVYINFVEIPVALKNAIKDGSITVTFMGCAEGKLCYPPTKRTVQLSEVTDNPGTTNTGTPTQQSVSEPITQQDSLNKMLSTDNLFLTLLIFFGLGVGLALTPCVFPMYPILSGIIVGQGQKLSMKKGFALSMAYVQGMAITYSLLGLIVASAGLKYQAALQHPAVLLVLATLFIVLSLSMFGLYDLKLPSKWQEKMNNASNNQKGGNLIGVFAMGAISGLVASPCTSAPLSGVLIYIAQTGNVFLGFIALYVLSMGMGLPLLIMGTSGGKLLPRAGGWMEIVKTIFGFLLIAVSIMMVGRIWPGVVSDVLWSVWGVTLTGYLMHQNKASQFNWKQTTRSVILILTLMGSFSYGFQAVMNHLGFNLATTEHAVVGEQENHGFIRVKTLADLKSEIAKASAQEKVVMFDLYADWCVACKEFENITFKDPEVAKRMNQIVLLQADVTGNDDDDIEIMENYDVLGLPTLMFFDGQGQLRDEYRVAGFMGPEEFASHLDLLLK
ncbi:protein-disulfide reductase DsbD [Parashewanella spongiae]|uniref:Thiol:disulfide interchange protein DsbD n=1 Tax=Parashewanella spongiae TaxID=342950 RepID=A0A3A6TDE0_9GAMM|nr:protein-disulfide reductase DsbD [Parashewanella spongiae]MCL1078533.1 protein-disulfide reductase DsbD [Parashewanella spongiae]RJY13449.1 protein-disulfide reductase DsbD [Parashewanella spongiae]